MARLFNMPKRLAFLILVLCGLGLGVPAAIVAQDVLTMDNEEQKDFLTNFVQDRLSTPER
jgi:translocation and assembly module TamB